MSFRRKVARLSVAFFVVVMLACLIASQSMAQEKRPNIVMLMTDDTGWNDFGAYGGGANLGHPTRTSIRSPRKAPCSPAGMARRAALRDALRS